MSSFFFFSDKYKKKKFKMSSAAVVISTLRVKEGHLYVHTLTACKLAAVFL